MVMNHAGVRHKYIKQCCKKPFYRLFTF